MSNERFPATTGDYPMRFFSSCLLFCFFLFQGSNTAGATVSKEDRLWLIENLIKPDAQLTFLVTVDNGMLTPGEKEITSQEIPDYSGMTNDEVNKAVEANSLQAEGYIHLNRRLQAEGKYSESVDILRLGTKRLYAALDEDPDNWQLAQEIQKLHRSVHQTGKARSLATAFLGKNPKHFEAMLDTAKMDIVAGDFDAARARIDQAYPLAPKEVDVYMTEFLYQLHQGQVAISQMKAYTDTLVWPLDTVFLMKATKENPNFITPQITIHGLKTMQIFYSMVLRNFSKLGRIDPFDFVLEKEFKQSLDESKAFFQNAKKKQGVSPYFRDLCLLMAAIVENDLVSAEKIFTRMRQGTVPENDPHRLMLIGFLSKGKIARAIESLKAGFNQHDTVADRLMVAWLYQQDDDYNAGLKTVMEYQGPLAPVLLVHRIGYGFLSDEPRAGIQLFHEYRKLKTLWEHPLFVYYGVVAEALSGNSEQAAKLLESFSPKTSWYKSGETIRRYFGKDRDEGS